MFVFIILVVAADDMHRDILLQRNAPAALTVITLPKDTVDK